MDSPSESASTIGRRGYQGKPAVWPNVYDLRVETQAQALEPWVADSPMLWTISDLHLSSVHPKPMDIFGDRWKNHPERIAAAWRGRVRDGDTVLIAGDISWAMKLDEALPDLEWIAALPGHKVLIRGNHDYWCPRGVGPVRRRLPPGMTILSADA